VVKKLLKELGIQCQAGDPPMALPADESQASAVMTLAARRGLRVLPVGLAHQLPHLRPNAAQFDLWLSTQRLQEIVQYEPGEATITVQAGMIWQHVQKLADSNRQCLSPTFAPESPRTVGGVIASGFSGFDRPRFGALRHQVLGMRVLMSDGTVATTGGRLVKNVAGFSLHRLHTGGRGQLGVILEASLALHNRPAETLVLQQGFDSWLEGVQASRRLHSARLPGAALLLRFDPAGTCQLSCTLQGSPGLIEDARKAAALTMDFEETLEGHANAPLQAENVRAFDLDAERAWLSITGHPTTVEAVQMTVHGWLAKIGKQASGILQPDVAQWLVCLDPNTPPESLGPLVSELHAHGAVVEALGSLAPLQPTFIGAGNPPLQAAVESIRRQFDPENGFQPRPESVA
jgi:FAD/FMN-containing dehydrogenase